MERKYKLFEVLPNGWTLKVRVVSGLEHARSTVRGLASHTTNECYAEDAETRQVVAQMNEPRANSKVSDLSVGDCVEKLISASRVSICDTVVAELALASTYCNMARSANHVVRRHHLFTLARTALVTAEEYVAAAPPELLYNILEDAERLRLEIWQLNAKESQDQGENHS